MKNDRKSCRLNVRVEPDIKDYILNQSKKSGKSESDCVRGIIQAARKHEVISFKDKKSFLIERELVREINKIGTNINQIVKNTNSHYYTDIEKKKLFAMMYHIESMISEILKQSS